MSITLHYIEVMNQLDETHVIYREYQITRQSRAHEYINNARVIDEATITFEQKILDCFFEK